MNVWQAVDAAVAAGQQPVIRLNTAMVKLAPAKPRGRPRKEKVIENLPYGHYLIAQLLGGKSRVRCLRVGCRKRLRADQHLGCSDYCNEAITNFLMRMLQLAMGMRLRLLRPVKGVAPV